jgi:hypothetical protein
MAEGEPSESTPFDASGLLPIVVGAHLRAEVADRPLAYQLRDRIMTWRDQFAVQANVDLLPVVVTDLWYMNQPSLMARPTISIGGPGVNALSAYYARHLPKAVISNEQVVVQLDPEWVDLRVCVWGMNHEQTVAALDYFVRDHLDAFLRAAVTQVEPKDE